MQVAPGTYQLVAFPVGSETGEFRPAAAYTNGSGIGVLTVAAGQVVEGIHVKNINSDNCVTYTFPASPDGRFPGLEENCSKLPTEIPPATIRGSISYQSPPTPASMLYFISGEHMYPLEVPGGSPVATFELQVAPGTYQLVAFPIGSENLAHRPAAAYTTGSGIGALTVTAGQVVEGIRVQNINSDRCVNYAFPASPDGRFPPIEESCSKLPAEIRLATVRGTIGYQAPPSPASMLYFISGEHWYVQEVPSGSPVSSFELQVAPGTYQVVAFPAGSENLVNRPAAAYTTGSGIGALTVTAGTGGGRYPGAEYQFRSVRYICFPCFAGWTLLIDRRELQQTHVRYVAGNYRRDHYLPGPAYSHLRTVFHQPRALVFDGSAKWKPGFNFQIAGSSRYLPVDRIPSRQ